MLVDALTKFSLPTALHLKHVSRMLSGTYDGPPFVKEGWGSVGYYCLGTVHIPLYPSHTYSVLPSLAMNTAMDPSSP